MRTVEGAARTDDKGQIRPRRAKGVSRAFLVPVRLLHAGFRELGHRADGAAAGQPVDADAVEEAVEAALDKHICRCTGYVRYYHAVRDLILATPGLTTGQRTREVSRHG
jgi:aerobic-type carbon monoxide dehydrogenase small subunit (CoxS/CutS family)